MNNYNFKYTDEKFGLKLFLFCFIIFVIIFVSLLLFAFHLINFFVLILVSIGIPLLFFYLNKKHIIKNGSVIMNEKEITFNLNNVTKKIKIDDIESYQIIYTENVILIIKIKNDKRLCIVTNPNFTQTTNFVQFCRSFETKMKLNKLYNSNALKIKSFFEQKCFYFFLIFLTSMYIILIIISLFKGLKLMASAFIALGPILSLWGLYLKSKNK